MSRLSVADIGEIKSRGIERGERRMTVPWPGRPVEKSTRKVRRQSEELDKSAEMGARDHPGGKLG